MVLVPEAEFLRMRECESRGGSTSLVEAVKNPEQGEMIKKYNFAQKILKDPRKLDDEKLSHYSEAMHDFAVFRNKMRNDQPAKEQISEKPIEHTVQMIPPSLQSHAKKLIDRLGANKDVISWTSKGEVSIHGKKLPGTNISDLVGDIIRAQKRELPEREHFLRTLHEMKIPENLIKNKTALAQYRSLKGEQRRPPGIPEARMRLEQIAATSTDDEFGISSDSGKRKRRRKTKIPIPWTNT